jgi:hypothetical protein
MSMIVNSFRFGGGGGGGGVTARYWRILVTDDQSGGSVPAISADNIEMRATAGGSDMTTTASNAISDSDAGGSFIDDYAFDGINGQFWVSSNAGGTYGTHWIGYDFGAGNDVEVCEVTWSKRPDSFGRNEAPTIALVQYSDDASTWTTYWAFATLNDWPTGAETRTFTKPDGTDEVFWRIRATSVQGGSSFGWATGEVEMKETAGGSDVVVVGVLQNGYALGSPSSSVPSQGFDDTTFTSFVSTNSLSTATNWLGFAFFAARTINEVTIQAYNNASGANNGITAGVVESSKDRVTWTEEWSFTTPATWVNSSTEVRTFTRP